MRLLIALCLLVSSVYAQAPGEVYVTPKIDLGLQPVGRGWNGGSDLERSSRFYR